MRDLGSRNDLKRVNEMALSIVISVMNSLSGSRSRRKGWDREKWQGKRTREKNDTIRPT